MPPRRTRVRRTLATRHGCWLPVVISAVWRPESRMLRYLVDGVSDIGGGGHEFPRKRRGWDGAAGCGSDVV
jgi:hypothetical protein